MEEKELKKLRQFYHSLLGQQQVFNEVKGNIDHHPVNVLTNELNELATDFPDLLPPFNQQNYFSHSHGRTSYYNSLGIRAYLNVALGRLKVSIDEPSSTPVTESRDFSFINSTELRKVLERDFSEIQRTYIAKCWKSVIILSGGAVEAILTDILLANSGKAQSASNAPSKSDITRWELSDLIKVSVELKLVSPGVEKLSHSLREYRNLVHPGREIRDKLSFDAEEARIALEVLNILYRDLSS